MLEISGVDSMVSSMPFMLMVAGSPQVNKTRMWEAVISAVVSGAVIAAASYLYAFPVLQEQVAQMRRDGQETRQLIRDLQVSNDVRDAKRDAIQAALEAKIVQLQIEAAKRR